MENLSDAELVARWRLEGLPAARKAEFVNELFSRYHSRVAAWCYRVTGDRESAADLAQDVFLKAHRSLEAWREQSKFSTWLYSITRNHCLNHLAAKAVRPEGTADSIEFDLHDTSGVPADERLMRESEILQMKQLLSTTLDQTEIQVMTLHYGEEIQLDAITALLGLSNTSGAKAYIVSAKRKLKTAISRWKIRTGAGK